MENRDVKSPELNEEQMEATAGGMQTHMELKVGDQVLISKYSGSDVKIDTNVARTVF